MKVVSVCPDTVSGRIYSGGNRLMLMMQGMDKGYADPRWLTYKQHVDKLLNLL